MTTALKVSEAASLAMHAMGLLASMPGQSLSVKTIAGRFKVSEAHLSKVMQRLVKVDLLTSVRGPKGGFSLTRPPDQTTLLSVFETIEGPMKLTNCLIGVQLCNGESCILGKTLVDANEMLHDRLSNTTLADLAAIFSNDPRGHI